MVHPFQPKHAHKNVILRRRSALETKIGQTEGTTMPRQIRTPATHKTPHCHKRRSSHYAQDTTVPSQKETPATHKMPHCLVRTKFSEGKKTHTQNKNTANKSKPSTKKTKTPCSASKPKPLKNNPLHKKNCDNARGQKKMPDVADVAEICRHICVWQHQSRIGECQILSVSPFFS